MKHILYCNIMCASYKIVIFFLSSRDLKESDADGFVQRAISAANVYNNIVKYTDDANITSLTTLNKSERAEEVSLTTFEAIVFFTKHHQPMFFVSGCC